MDQRRRLYRQWAGTGGAAGAAANDVFLIGMPRPDRRHRAGDRVEGGEGAPGPE